MALKKVKIGRVSCALVAALILAACNGGGTTENGDTENGDGGEAGSAAEQEDADQEDVDQEELVPVRWAVSTTSPGPAQTPYWSAPEGLGYWEEEGLDVEVLGFAGSVASVQAVDAGQADVAIASGGATVSGILAGADLRTYYVQVTRGYGVPGVVEDSPIQTVEDFEGATIGVQSLESGAVPVIQAMLEDAGIPAENVEFVAMGTGAEAAEFIRRGDIDVVGLWDSARAEVEMLGIPLRIVATEEYIEAGWQQVLVAPTEMFEGDGRDVLIGLARGLAKASIFADENPEAAIRINWELYPESKPAGVDDDEAMEQALTVYQSRSVNTQPNDGIWGMEDADEVRAEIGRLFDAGLISEVPDTVDGIWTDDMIEEINNFDHEAIREQAQNFDIDSFVQS